MTRVDDTSGSPDSPGQIKSGFRALSCSLTLIGSKVIRVIFQIIGHPSTIECLGLQRPSQHGTLAGWNGKHTMLPEETESVTRAAEGGWIGDEENFCIEERHASHLTRANLIKQRAGGRASRPARQQASSLVPFSQ